MLLSVWKIKKTGEIVIPVGKVDANHTACLFKFKTRTRRGNLGVIQSVNNENLKKEE